MNHADRYFRLIHRPFGPIKKPIEDRVAEAIAWGVPDRESTGMSHSELTSLLAEQRDRIRELEAEVRRLRSGK